MIRPLLAAMGCCLLLSACGGRDPVQEELDRIKADGSPLTLEDLGLPPGGYESPQWKTILDISEKLAKERKERDLNYQTTAMKPVGPGMAEVATRQETLSALQNKKPITWVEWNKMLATTRTLMDGVPALEAGPVFIPDYSRGVAAKMPQIKAALDLTKAASWMILADIHDGNIDRALGGLSEARQRGKNLTGNSTLIEGLVRVTCDSVLLTVSWELLQQPKINEYQMARLSGIWEATFDAKEALKIWQGERVTSWQTFSKFQTQQGLEEWANSQDAEWPSFKISGWSLIYRFIVKYDLAYYLSIYHQLENDIVNWITNGKYMPARQELQKQEEFLKNIPKWKRMRYLISSLALPSLTTANDKFASTIAQQHLLKTAIALKRYQLAHKAWPDSLDQLVPSYLPSVPLDPIDGQPLRYKKSTHEADGYTLYSIGVNGIDDGGDGTEMKPREKGKPDYRPDKTRDILWPRVAP